MIPENIRMPEDVRRYTDAVRGIMRDRGCRPAAFIRTFGCQQNEADSERLAGLCRAMGYTITDVPEEAELILVNTCAVREHAEKKALSIIGSYKHLREKNPALIIGVGGCMVTQGHRADKLKMSYPYVNFVFDTGSLHKLPELVYGALSGGGRRIESCGEKFEITEGIPVAPTTPYKAWLSIMYGCNNFCTYCIVPYVRGRERSRTPDDILEEARRLIDGGALDITLLGQNVNSYGRGCDFDCDIADLMHMICRIPGDFRLRFMTSHPKDASDKLIAVMAEEEKVVPHFHLPLQSGSDDVLRRMNRRYTSEDYLRIVEKLKRAVPDVSITSDIIVGFPGESDADFEDTLRVIREVEYDMLFSFIYSPRVGTPAADMDGQITKAVSNERFDRLLALQNDISIARNRRFIGREMTVLAEEVSRTDKRMITGRGDPVRPVHFAASPEVIGKNIKVRIDDADTFSLIASVIK